ncbi:MAG: outer membrane beta-barrel family protein [bacterium]
MRTRIGFISLFTLLLLGGLSAEAQVAAPPRQAVSGPGEIRGRLVDSVSQHAVTSGSITVRRVGDSSFAGGALPKPDGSFHVDGLVPGRYTLRIRALGFAQLAKNDIIISADKPMVDVGALALTVVAAKLSGQDVVAEREEQVLAPDRNSYSAKNMTSASGGTAIDVLRNIPLVEVDGSNKVSLRGNGNVVVQINGRSSPLKGEQLGAFLAQLPAGSVKNVEVATNPSAKDDPEGTAGIINIVLNQEAELGLSGGVVAGTSSTGQINSSGNVGKQQGKFTGFLSGSLYRDRRFTSGKISRTNLLIPVPVFVETNLDGKQRPISGGATVRTEYRLSEIDVFSADGFLYAGHYGGSNALAYTDLDESRNVIGAFNQFNEQLSKNLSLDYDVAFRRQGPPTIAQFSAEIEYANNDNTNDTDLSGNLLKSDPATPVSIPTEHDRTISHNPYVNAKLDYSKPFSTTTKLETGFKGIWRKQSSDFTAAYRDSSTGIFEINPVRTTGFDYHENIVGAYGLFSQRASKVQLQAGLRLEDANTHFLLPGTSQQFDKDYKSAYPSAIVSYNFSPMRQAKVSYSRRVSRPNPYQLSPIEFKQDQRNVFRGNPNLGAEYTNAFELGLQDAHSWGSIQLNPYLRQTMHAVRNIQFVDSMGVSVSTFDNVASTTTIGTDLNLSYHTGPLQMYGGGSAYHYKSDASNLSGNLSASDIIWSLRSNATWKFSTLIDAQLFANYRAPFRTEGGSQLAMVNMNAGFRYKVWGDQGNISLRLSDPFKLQKFGYKTANGTVVELSERYFGSRAVFITVSRNFGQALKLRPKSDPDASQPAPGPGTP